MDIKNILKSDYDHLRTALMCEPRGHRDMVGALLIEPLHPEADLGAIFMDAHRWINMCGHATIGCAAVAVENNLVTVQEPWTNIIIDTPAGLIRTCVKVDQGRVIEVALTNVDSFMHTENLSISACGYDLLVDVAYGGSFFVLVDAGAAGIDLSYQNISNLIPLASSILKTVNKKVEIRHPHHDIHGAVNVEFFRHNSSRTPSQCNIVISEEGQFDRSPCGTGTSAQMAALHAKGKLRPGQTFISESITGTRFKGEIKSEISVGPYPGITPVITGSAHTCGYATHVIEESDPLKYGLSLH